MSERPFEPRSGLDWMMWLLAAYSVVGGREACRARHISDGTVYRQIRPTALDSNQSQGGWQHNWARLVSGRIRLQAAHAAPVFHCYSPVPKRFGYFQLSLYNISRPHFAGLHCLGAASHAMHSIHLCVLSNGYGPLVVR